MSGLAYLVLGVVRAGVDGRTVMATLPADAVPGVHEELTVLEDLHNPASPIVFKGSTLHFAITKTAELQVPGNDSKTWGGHGVDRILNEEADLLGNALLALGRDPTYADVEPLFPPVLANYLIAGDYDLTGQTFIGSRLGEQKRSFTATGGMNGLNIDQRYHLNQTELLLNKTYSGLLGGFTPAVRWWWPLPKGDYAEQIAFAVPESTAEREFTVSSTQPLWIRYLNVSEKGELRYAHYVDTFEQYPNFCRKAEDAGGFPNHLECNGGNAEGFYASLLKFSLYWNKTFTQEESMEVSLPAHGINVGDFAKHSIARMMITRRDTYFPRYGAPPLYYAACCDGFQDVFVADMATYLEWGLLDTAKGVMDNYYTYYIRRGAIVDYRGPELAQYGRMLTLAAQYYKHTGDAALLLKHSLKLLDISDMLISRRRTAQKLDQTDPSFGMIRGEDESDEMFAWTEATCELPHISFSLEAWRGFRDLGPIWVALGAAHKDAEMLAKGKAMVAEAPLILVDVHHAMAASVVNATAGPNNVCHPYVAGEPTCADMGAAGAHVTHTNGTYNGRASEPWRSYAGMFYSGALNESVVKDIVGYNQFHEKLSHIGAWGGVGGFRNQIMSFTEQGHGYGLVQHGMAEPFLLQLYSEMAHVCTRGSWTCFESRGIPNFTPAGGYTTPSQSIVPLHVKWMLVWEDPLLANSVVLCKTTPRSWLQHGETIAVHRAPTTVGASISFNITSSLSGTTPTIVADVAFAPGGATKWDAEDGAEIDATLTLRAPKPYRIKSVAVDGNAYNHFNPSTETVTLPAVSKGADVSMHVVVTYAHVSDLRT